MVEKKNTNDVNYEDLLFKNRQILLYDDINIETSKDVCKKLMTLDIIDNTPIHLWINSEGGCPHCAFAIIDIMESCKSQIYTIINGQACSSAGIISICGDKRYATKRTMWMMHPVSEANDDYTDFLKDRLKCTEKVVKMIEDIHVERTKLTSKDIQKYQSGELWIKGIQLIRKGIIDEML